MTSTCSEYTYHCSLTTVQKIALAEQILETSRYPCSYPSAADLLFQLLEDVPGFELGKADGVLADEIWAICKRLAEVERGAK